MKTLWDLIKYYYKIKFNIPPEYIEFVACYSILLDCVVGYSTKSIARRHKLPQDYVESVLVEYFNFFGWEDDLDISPIAIYRKTNKNFDYFVQEILTTSAYIDYNDFKRIFLICKKFDVLDTWAKDIEKTIE